jgi:hypothetical protein
MSECWLKMIGTTEGPCPEHYTVTYADFARRPRRIRPGDRMVLYAVGRRKQVFALAQVTSEVYASGWERWPYRLDINYSLNLPVSSGVNIEQVNTSKRDLLRPIRRQASYFELDPDEYERAARKLREASESIGNAEPGAPTAGGPRIGDLLP